MATKGTIFGVQVNGGISGVLYLRKSVLKDSSLKDWLHVSACNYGNRLLLLLFCIAWDCLVEPSALPEICVFVVIFPLRSISTRNVCLVPSHAPKFPGENEQQFKTGFTDLNLEPGLYHSLSSSLLQFIFLK